MIQSTKRQIQSPQISMPHQNATAHATLRLDPRTGSQHHIDDPQPVMLQAEWYQARVEWNQAFALREVLHSAQTPEQEATARNNLAQLLQATNCQDEAEQAAVIDAQKASVEQGGSS